MELENVREDVAHGMKCWERTDNATLSNYTTWQSELISPWLGQRVMEIGPGAGRMASVLNSTHHFDRYVAVEPSHALHQKFKQECPRVESVNKHIEDLGEEFDGQFDTLLLVHVLEHIEDDESFLRSTLRFLRPKGRLIVMVPAIQFLMSDLDRNIGHFRRYQKKSLSLVGTRAGYLLLENRYDNLIGIFGWLWFCKIRKVHYQETGKKKVLLGAFGFFDKVVLPLVSKIEKVLPPPIGLNLTAVFMKP